MPVEITSLADLTTLPFDDIIDVRAPAEYAEDHIPGAINLPVLSDAERARVGTIYVQDDRFLARKVGAALVARNAARHIEDALADKPGGWRPLVYCWRGGQRSGSFASILAQIGWRVETIEGGYKRYRSLIVRALYQQPVAHRLVLIDGGTGTAKTRLLVHLAQAGAQVLDLEALAAHRGSLFGAIAQAQPSQKHFETRLALALGRLDPARPVFVEAESNKIGEVLVPPSLWKAMRQADVVQIDAPLAARADYLVTAYADLLDDPDRIQTTLAQLTAYHGHAQVEVWQHLAACGAYRDLAADLVERHYDPRYSRMSERQAGRGGGAITLPDLSDPALKGAADEILNRFKGFNRQT